MRPLQSQSESRFFLFSSRLALDFGRSSLISCQLSVIPAPLFLPSPSSTMATLDGAAAWPAVHDAVTNIRLPLVEELEDTAWLTHTSYHGAIHHRFETNAGGEALDYERLEVGAADSPSPSRPRSKLPSFVQHVGDALLGAEVALLVHKLFPRLVIGVRTASQFCIGLSRQSSLTGLPHSWSKPLLSPTRPSLSPPRVSTSPRGSGRPPRKASNSATTPLFRRPCS